MAKIPKSAKKEIPRKCPICGNVFKSKEYLVLHIDKSHSEEIPENWSASRYENYLRTKKDFGSCVVCKRPTTWNESTWKYNRLCGRKECSDKLSKEADKNMIDKFGKVHLLNDANHQRKMIYSKKNSGSYYWSTDKKKEFKKMYASSVELKFLEMLDVFLNLDMHDVISPSPNNYTYKYEGEDHIYIPDVYIPSINLEIELKEPADNPNTHPKIQAVDKVKESLKDDMMDKIPNVNYIKVNGSDYRAFFEYFNYLKNTDYSDNNSTVVKESAFTMDDFMFDSELQSIMDEMYQEPVTEKKEMSFFEKGFDKCESLMSNISLSTDKNISSLSNIIKESEDIYVTEGYDKDAWYQDVEESSIIGQKGDRLYKPVFVILTYTKSTMAKMIKAVTDGTYSHASISLDTSMKNMCSFNRKGFVDEDITGTGFMNEGAEYCLYMYLATNDEYNTINGIIEEFQKHRENFKYSIKGLFNYLLNKETEDKDEWFCSEFVSYLLSQANPKLLKRHYSLYSPDDLRTTRKMIKISNGFINAYNPDIIDRKIRKELNKRGFENVTITNK